MRSSLIAGALACAVSVVASRPDIVYKPEQPFTTPPTPAARTKQCVVKTHGDNETDDSPYILKALHACNNGGHVVFSADTTYLIGTAMDWTFLSSVDLDIRGEILFSDDTDYWQAHAFDFVFQNVTTFFKLGGDDVFVYGGGTLNGNGQVWYDLYAKDEYTKRPVLIGIDGLNNSIIADLVLRYSPEYYTFIANSTNVVFDGINISGYSSSDNEAKNTDGWDTYRCDGVTIQNSVVNNGDDCVAFKPNSTNILVQNMWCNGSHGISVGSLGQYEDTYDIVENVLAVNVSMHNASDGARIKVWPDAASAVSDDLQGGGGEGRVSNITFRDFVIDNVDYAIEIDQCYGQDNLTLCAEHPSRLTIANVRFSGFSGKTSDKYMPLVAAFACSSNTTCSDIKSTDFNVLSPNGTSDAYCLNFDNADLDGVTCVDTVDDFN